MKFYTLPFLLFISILAWSPQISSVVVNELSMLLRESLPVIINVENTFTDRRHETDNLHVKGSGIAINYSHNNIIKLEKTEAQKNGANTIKFTTRKNANTWRKYEIITGRVYKVADVKKYENEIEWSEKRQLGWEDFKGIAPVETYENIAALTNCGFGFSTRAVFPFTKPKFTVANIFYPRLSWVNKSEQYRPELLEHEQLHFDISERYARQLRMEFQTSRINYFNLKKKAEAIFKKVHSSYLLRQELYEQETNFSLNTGMQKMWKARIKDELFAMRAYAKK